MIDLSKHRLPIFFAILIFVVSTTLLAIKFAQGYRLDLTTKTLKPTGLLVATSNPRGAEVYVDGKLLTATDNTISLPPADYWVEIKKTGYYSWQKRLLVEKELVTQAEAFLFPQIPDLKPLTFSGTQNPLLSPDGSKLLYTVPLPQSQAGPPSLATGEAGLWILDLSDFLFGLSKEPRQIILSRPGRDFGLAEYHWSLDSKQVLVKFDSGEKFLLDASQANSVASLTNISVRLPQIIEGWQKEDSLKEEAKKKKLPEAMKEILKVSAQNLEFSPDGTKVLYQATASAEIPEKLIPPILASSNQPESRLLEANNYYVYDLKEDRNFLLPFNPPPATPTPTPTVAKSKTRRQVTPTPTPTPTYPLKSDSPPIRWFPTSRHLYWINTASDGSGDKVVACEYDGGNLTPIYSGPFVKPYVFAAPGANKLIILTRINLDTEAQPNLYSVSLR